LNPRHLGFCSKNSSSPHGSAHSFMDFWSPTSYLSRPRPPCKSHTGFHLINLVGTTQAINGNATDAQPLTLLWKKHYVPMILSGKKTATRRVKRPTVKVGSTYNIKTGFFDHLPERIHIDALYTQKLGDITDGDAMREGVEGLQGFIEEWRALTGAWSPDDSVWVVEFHLAEPSGSC
jgi:hypothetical protein